MSIVVRDMKMPDKCGDCAIYVCYRTWNGDPGDEFCGVTKESVSYKTKPDWCPLSEIPERKKGKWITQQFGSWAECSECHDLYDIPVANSNFCPNCGADMMEGEKE